MERRPGRDTVCVHFRQSQFLRGFHRPVSAFFGHGQVKLLHVLSHHAIGRIRGCQLVHAGTHSLQPLPGNALFVLIVEVRNDLLFKQIKQFIQDDITTAGTYSQEQFGIEDAPEQIQTFLGLVEKWTAIAEELDNDPQAIAERVQEEVWSKVDYATYGE